MSKIKLSETFIKDRVKLALTEDLYPNGDITSSLIRNDKIIQASALDSNIKKLGIEGYKTLNKFFTIDTMIEKLEEFFLKF